jgi:hypothetical protein
MKVKKTKEIAIECNYFFYISVVLKIEKRYSATGNYDVCCLFFASQPFCLSQRLLCSIIILDRLEANNYLNHKNFLPHYTLD